MVEQFQNLLAFFGVTGVPQNFAELVPWLVTVLACLAIFWVPSSSAPPVTWRLSSPFSWRFPSCSAGAC